MQEVFFDYFYHELSGLGEQQAIFPGRIEEALNAINLDDTLQQEELNGLVKAKISTRRLLNRQTR